MRLGTIAALTTAFLAATLAPASAARSDVFPVPPSGQFTVTGNGFGHGRGMSQYGAYGRAQAGQGADSILSFYYPGTTTGRVAGALRVLVSADTTRDVVVRPAPRLRVHAGRHTYRISHRGAKAYRLLPHATRTAVQYRAHGRWHRMRWVSPTAEFLSSAGRLTLVLPGGRSATYRGRLRSVGTRTVNVVPVEAYLRGVVAAEMPSTWSASALQAQAVAARTYAWYLRARNAARPYDLCDTTACQVYGGVARETTSTDAAVAATRARILLLAGAPAFTEFSASNGGETAGWLSNPPQADPYDTAYRGWTQVVSSTTIGSPTTITLNKDASGRVTTAVLSGGPAGTRTLTGDQFRSAYGLRSTLFTLS